MDKESRFFHLNGIWILGIGVDFQIAPASLIHSIGKVSHGHRPALLLVHVQQRVRHQLELPLRVHDHGHQLGSVVQAPDGGHEEEKDQERPHL